MESKSKNKLKIVVPVVLGTGLLVSLGVNGWLYSQIKSSNHGITDVQTELSSLHKEYELLSLKIKDDKQSLLEQQEENGKLEQEKLQVQSEEIKKQEKEALSKPTKTVGKETTNSKSTTPIQPSGGNTGGNSGGYPKTEFDKDGNGIEDKYEDSIAPEGGGDATHMDDSEIELGEP